MARQRSGKSGKLAGLLGQAQELQGLQAGIAGGDPRGQAVATALDRLNGSIDKLIKEIRDETQSRKSQSAPSGTSPTSGASAAQPAKLSEFKTNLFGRGVGGLASQGISQIGAGSLRAGFARAGPAGVALSLGISAVQAAGTQSALLSTPGVTASERGLRSTEDLVRRLTFGLGSDFLQASYNRRGITTARQTVSNVQSQANEYASTLIEQGFRPNEISGLLKDFTNKRFAIENQKAQAQTRVIPQLIEEARANPLTNIIRQGGGGASGGSGYITGSATNAARAMDRLAESTDNSARSAVTPGGTRR